MAGTATGFYGRAEEVAWLRAEFEACAARGKDTRLAGPRMAFVIAETGHGKSRLVQELYLQLAADPEWNPREFHYWPGAFGRDATKLLVVPDMTGHDAAGPPRFAWLGVRWPPTDVPNVLEHRSLLTDVRALLEVHAGIRRAHESAWKDAVRRLKEVLPAAVDVAADVALPFGGVIIKLVDEWRQFVEDRAAGPRPFSALQAELEETLANQLLACMTSLLGNKGAIPTVLWLDDAQWIDQRSLAFLSRLWDEASRQSWPLLVVLTHWEREWRELSQESGDEATAPSLPTYVGKPGVSVRMLATAADADLAALVQERLPGLTKEQRSLLLDKAGGNYLTMVENLGHLACEPANFVDRDIKARLAPIGEKMVRDWESDRQRHVQRRFKDLEPPMKTILGFGGHGGARFLHEAVTDFAASARDIHDAAALIQRCVDPFVILARPTQHLCEFRDTAYQHVARQYFNDYLADCGNSLSAVLRRHLVEKINASFDDHGDESEPHRPGVTRPPKGGVAAMTWDERRDVLEMAMRELPLSASSDWSSVEHVAMLRGAYLLARHEPSIAVKSAANILAAVPWDRVPTDVLSVRCRRRLLRTATVREAGAHSQDLAADVIMRARVEHDQLGSYRTGRALADGLVAAAGADLERGERCAALEKCVDAASVLRELDQRLGTPDSREGLCWGLRVLAEAQADLGDPEAARATYAELAGIDPG